MENKELVLISKNEEQAQASIENWKLRAKETSNVVKYFNSIKLLNEITTEKELLSFLKNPISYFHKRIMMDIQFSSKIQPPPEGVADLYKIPYSEIVQRLGVCPLRDLTNMVFDEKTQIISFDTKSTEKILLSFHEFATDKIESDEIIKIRKIAKELNNLAERFGLQAHNLSSVSNALGFLSTRVKSSGHGYEFYENLTYLRERLEYEKMHDL